MRGLEGEVAIVSLPDPETLSGRVACRCVASPGNLLEFEGIPGISRVFREFGVDRVGMSAISLVMFLLG